MSLKPHDALANLAAHADTLPEPYLVTGPQAGYLYHRWLSPISKMVDLSIPQESVATWQAILPEPWVVLTHPPTYTLLRQTTRMAILEPSLSESLWARRVIYQGLPFISPEDLSLHLLRTAKTSLGLSEIAALLIEQKETLDWSYLYREIDSEWLSHRLKEIIWSANQVAGYSLITTPFIEPTTTRRKSLVLTKEGMPRGTRDGQIRAYLDDSLIDRFRPLHAQSPAMTLWEESDVRTA